MPNAPVVFSHDPKLLICEKAQPSRVAYVQVDNTFVIKTARGGTASPAATAERIAQRHPEVFIWPSVFLEAWGAKAKNHTFPGNVWFFGLGTPGLQKTTWPNNHFGMPLTRI